MHKFRNLGHVTAVRGLVKNDVDLVECSSDRIPIPHVALDKFRLPIDPRWPSAAMRLRFKIIKRAYSPAFVHETVDNVRADQACATSDQGAFSHALF